MRSLELRVPPPVVAAIFAALMWLASFMFESAGISIPFRTFAAVALACIGGAFGVPAMISFVRARTTMNPMKAATASSLVTHGVYRISRNPMYLSLLLYLAAWAMYLSNWIAAVFLPLFVIFMNEFQIKPEERVLATLFGSGYAEYKARVRRWI